MVAKQAVSYLRRSTRLQDRSISDQRRMIKRFASIHDYKVVREFVDDGISGAAKPEKRESFMNMIKFVESQRNRIAAVLVYDISRFARTGSDEVAYYRHRLKLAGCQVVYIVESIPEGSSGDLVRNVLQWQKREYIKQLARDVIRGQVAVAEEGYRAAGSPPYGYVRCLVSQDGRRRVPKKGELFLRRRTDKVSVALGDPEAVATVQRIFRMYTDEGLGYLRIAECLNKKGVKTSIKHRYWTVGKVRRILCNPIYAGISCFNRHSAHNLYSIRNRLPKKVTNKKGHSLNPESEWIMVKSAHKAIVDCEIFERAQMSRKHRAFKHGSASGQVHDARLKKRFPFLLSGLVYCGHCGSKLRGYRPSKKGKGKKYQYSRYLCAGYARSGKTFCLPYGIDSRRLDALVLDLLMQQLISHNSHVGQARENKRALATDKGPPNGTQEPDRRTSCVSIGSESLSLDPRARSIKHHNHDWASHGVAPCADASPNCNADAYEDYSAQLSARELARSLVRKVTLHFKPVKLGSKRVLYELEDGLLQLSPPFLGGVASSFPFQNRATRLPVLDIDFDGSDLVRVRTDSLENNLFSFATSYYLQLSALLSSRVDEV